VLLSISGLPGSGTSSVSRLVAARLGVEHVDGGTVFRTLAAERGMALAEFGALAESDPTIDRELDARLAARAREGDVVLESRLSGWILTNEGLDGLRVWIECDPAERARRVSARDGGSLEEAVAANTAREASEAARYLAYYGIDIADLGVYDLVLDSTSVGVDDLVDAISSAAAAPG
jgi:predicted cytidylate kinase